MIEQQQVEPGAPPETRSCSQESSQMTTTDSMRGAGAKEKTRKSSDDEEERGSSSSEDSEECDSVLLEFKRKIRGCIRRTRVSVETSLEPDSAGVSFPVPGVGGVAAGERRR